MTMTTGERAGTTGHRFAMSVDVAAAVRALTERTRPSLAFDVVRIVRRALALGAQRIEVKCERDRFTVRWHGPSANAEELALIRQVLSPELSSQERSSVLLQLEENHSLALLAVFATAERCEVHGRVTGAAARGRVVAAPPMSAKNAVVVVRAGGSGVAGDAMAKEERNELARWCCHADAPIVVDGKRIDRPFRLGDARSVRSIKGPHGRALVGVADDPRKARTIVYSYGVYVGVRPRPRGSLPLIALVSARAFGPEDDTRLAMKAADLVIAAAETRLMDAVAGRFDELPHHEQRAIREALLDGDGRLIASGPLATLPLFDAVGAPFSLSMTDLRAAADRTGSVPAAAHPRGHLPGTPLLDARARSFVTRALGDVLRPAPPTPGAWAARLFGSPRLTLR